MDSAINLVLTVMALTLAGRILPGVHVKNLLTAVILALILGLATPFVQPLLLLIGAQVHVFTIGAMTLGLTSLVVIIVAAVLPGFHVDGIGAAMLLCVVASFVHVLLTIAIASV